MFVVLTSDFGEFDGIPVFPLVQVSAPGTSVSGCGYSPFCFEWQRFKFAVFCMSLVFLVVIISLVTLSDRKPSRFRIPRNVYVIRYPPYQGVKLVDQFLSLCDFDRNEGVSSRSPGRKIHRLQRRKSILRLPRRKTRRVLRVFSCTWSTLGLLWGDEDLCGGCTDCFLSRLLCLTLLSVLLGGCRLSRLCGVCQQSFIFLLVVLKLL